MNVVVRPVGNRSDIRRFIAFPDRLYRGDPLYVPALRSDVRKGLVAQILRNASDQPAAAFLAERDGEVVGRIWLSPFVARPGTSTERLQGAFNMFECVDDQAVADALFEAADAWFSARGIDYYYGNLNPKDPDDSRGVLTDGFDVAPVTMCVYNKPYYRRLFDTAGFGMAEDFVSYRLALDDVPYERYQDTIDAIKKRFRFTVDDVDPRRVDREARDIIACMNNSIADDWDQRPPEPEKVYELLDSWKRFLDFDYIKIARTFEGEPIGFTMAVPNFNEILVRLHGRLGPIGLLKLLYYRKRIRTVRAMIQTVTIPYQGKGVINAMYAAYFDLLKRRGVTWVDASTIGMENHKSRNAIEKLGGRIYKVFRLYDRELPAKAVER
ncbi:MAG: hypothetical protein WC509_05550 [Candidatus Izemoplasmatales bacterium]